MLVAHLVWSALVVLGAAWLILTELATPCPPGGLLAFDSCGFRPFATSVTALAAGLYVLALSGVLWWTRGLQRRGVADARASRDWYLLAALVGLPAAPLLAFTLAAALR